MIIENEILETIKTNNLNYLFLPQKKGGKKTS